MGVAGAQHYQPSICDVSRISMATASDAGSSAPSPHPDPAAHARRKSSVHMPNTLYTERSPEMPTSTPNRSHVPAKQDKRAKRRLGFEGSGSALHQVSTRPAGGKDAAGAVEQMRAVPTAELEGDSVLDERARVKLMGERRVKAQDAYRLHDVHAGRGGVHPDGDVLAMHEGQQRTHIRTSPPPRTPPPKKNGFYKTLDNIQITPTANL